MNEPQTTTAAIRKELFRKAEVINQQLITRISDVIDHLSSQEDRAVIGALEGTEADIAKIRSLMLLLRDCFALPREEGGALIQPPLMLTVLFNAIESAYSIQAHNQPSEEAASYRETFNPRLQPVFLLITLEQHSTHTSTDVQSCGTCREIVQRFNQLQNFRRNLS